MKRLVAATMVAIPIIAGAQQQNQPREALSADGGRFVLGQIGQYENSMYLLDTKTGRVWQIVRYMTPEGKDGGNALAPIRYIVQGGQQTDEPPPPRK